MCVYLQRRSLLEWCSKRIDDLAELGRDPWQRHLLERRVRVPLLAYWCPQTLLVLRPRLEWVWDLRHCIRRCLLVAPLVDDDMRQLGILALARLNTLTRLCLLHHDVLLLLGTLTSPRALSKPS